MKSRVLPILFLLISFSMNSQVFVKADAIGNNDGTTWNDAYTDLDLAINATEESEIWVAAGVYKPTTDLNGASPTNEVLKTFRLKRNIAIYGGFKGDETSLNQRDWKIYESILSGDIGVLGDSTDNVRHVVSAEYADLNLNTILDGLTIKGGYTGSQYSGAGIYVNQTSGGSFAVRNCTIESNYGFRDGGGIYVFNSNPIIENNIIRNNQAGEGGGVYLYYSNAILKNNDIINNKAGNGGGVHIAAYSTPVLKNNVFKQNIAITDGGGINIDSNYHTFFEGNQVLDNQAKNGGGIFLDYSETFFFNNVFAKNYASEKGGGIFMNYTPGPKFINNTVIGNTADQNGGGFYFNDANALIVNSIIFENRSGNGNQGYARGERGDWYPVFKFCNVEDGLDEIPSLGDIVFENNISVLPNLISSTTYEYHLPPSSNMIDIGTTDAELIMGPWDIGYGQTIEYYPNTDLTGNPRIYNNLIDLGAYEAQTIKKSPPPLFSIEVIGESCVGSQNGQILVSTSASDDYIASIGESTYNFNSTLVIDNFGPGTYTLCITQIGAPNFEQCFNLVVEAAQEISGKSNTSKINSRTIETFEIESGTAPYTIAVNGIEVLKTKTSSFSIDVNTGDIISVSSFFPCEGTMKKIIQFSEEAFAYPNPVTDIVYISVPEQGDKEIVLRMYDIQQRLLHSEKCFIINGKLEFSVGDRPSGIYLLQLEFEKPLFVKIVKQ